MHNIHWRPILYRDYTDGTLRLRLHGLSATLRTKTRKMNMMPKQSIEVGDKIIFGAYGCLTVKRIEVVGGTEGQDAKFRDEPYETVIFTDTHGDLLSCKI